MTTMRDTELQLVLANPWSVVPEIESGEYLSDDEFDRRGRILAEALNETTKALGALLDYKMKQDGVGDETTRTDFIDYWAREWGISRATLIRGWTLVTKHPNVPIPEDIPETAAYTILANTDTEEEAEAAFETASEEAYTTREVREARNLQRAGMQDTKDWLIPRLYKTGNEIRAKKNGEEITIAVLQDNGSELSRAGIHLLLRRVLK